MGKCVKCGKQGLFLRISKEGLCPDCMRDFVAELERRAEQRRAAEEAAEKARIEDMLVLKKHLELEACWRKLEEEERQ